MDNLEQYSKDELIQMAFTDLARLAHDSHELILKGSFPAPIADDVASLLRRCENIVNALTSKKEEPKAKELPSEAPTEVIEEQKEATND
jgi:hypothetical protein